MQTHPIQYFAPLYRRITARDNIDTTVVYLTDAGAVRHFDSGFGREVAWDIDLLSGYRSIVLMPNTSITDKNFFERRAPGITQVLRTERPDWVHLSGYASLANWQTATFAKALGAKLIYGSDSNARIPTSLLRSASKHVAVRLYFSLFDRFLWPSEANRDYLLRFGAAKTKLTWSPFAIDVDHFRSHSRPAARRDFDFVFAGKLLPRKGAGDYVHALRSLRARGHSLRALLIGSGSEEPKIRQAASELLNDGSLEMPGFLQQRELAMALGNCACLVFPSTNEPYGLIVSEAAAAGCAIIATSSSGSVGASGSAQPDFNALVYDAGDVNALEHLMERVLTDSNLRMRLQRASDIVARQHSIEQSARCIESVVLGNV